MIGMNMEIVDLWFFIEPFKTGYVWHQKGFCYLFQDKEPFWYNIELFSY